MFFCFCLLCGLTSIWRSWVHQRSAWCGMRQLCSSPGGSCEGGGRDGWGTSDANAASHQMFLGEPKQTNDDQRFFIGSSTSFTLHTPLQLFLHPLTPSPPLPPSSPMYLPSMVHRRTQQSVEAVTTSPLSSARSMDTIL